ncbi:MAG: homocysteine S-methyltransferase [Christensenellaceae bacterium]|jgi:homocysteine S-methyltransferase
MNPIQALLRTQKVGILDGATSTLLGERGNNISGKLWSARVLYENPSAVQEIHYDYYKAGADFSTTISYQATVKGFMDAGFSKHEAEKLLQNSIFLAQAARDTFWAETENRAGRAFPLVAASVGAYGAYLGDGSEYRGNYGISKAELYDFHAERFRILQNAAPDILACETLPSLEEAIVLAEIASSMPKTFIWISFSCKDEAHISDGTPLSECINALEGYDCIAALGLNCTPPEYVVSLIGAMKHVTSKPLLVYPNAGRIYDAQNKIWLGAADGLSFADRAKIWCDAGAQLIGGCCETTLEDIASVRKALLS